MTSRPTHTHAIVLRHQLLGVFREGGNDVVPEEGEQETGTEEETGCRQESGANGPLGQAITCQCSGAQLSCDPILPARPYPIACHKSMSTP